MIDTLLATAALLGRGAEACWAFLPKEGKEPYPAVVFLHGWMMTEPVSYSAWIEHLLAEGYAVLYPVYQAWRFEPPSEACYRRLVHSLKAAFDSLPLDTSKVAAVGHSFGGVLAVCLAANARHDSLPQPKAVMAVEPGGPLPLCFRPGKIPKEVRFAVVVGEEDRLVGRGLGELAFRLVPCEKKWFFDLWEADHSSPLCSRRAPWSLRALAGFSGRDGLAVNELDSLGFWKIFDGLLNCAFQGKCQISPKVQLVLEKF